MGWWKKRANINITRRNARAERQEVHEALANLHWRSKEFGEDHTDEIAELHRREELLDIAVKTGQFPG